MGNIDLKLSLFENGVQERADVIDRFKTKGFPNTAMRQYHSYE